MGLTASPALRRLGALALALLISACVGGGSKTAAELATESLDRGVQAQNAGRTPEALVAYFETLAKDPRQKVAFYNLGQIYRLENKLVIAEGYYRQALEIDPEYPPALFGFGFTRLAVGAWQEAHDANVKVIAADPNNAAAHFNRALALRGLGREREAQEEFARAAQLDRALVPPPLPTPRPTASPAR
jgi:Tfp pilus assembly protein PilF